MLCGFSDPFSFGTWNPRNLVEKVLASSASGSVKVPGSFRRGGTGSKTRFKTKWYVLCVCFFDLHTVKGNMYCVFKWCVYINKSCILYIRHDVHVTTMILLSWMEKLKHYKIPWFTGTFGTIAVSTFWGIIARGVACSKNVEPWFGTGFCFTRQWCLGEWYLGRFGGYQQMTLFDRSSNRSDIFSVIAGAMGEMLGASLEQKPLSG